MPSRKSILLLLLGALLVTATTGLRAAEITLSWTVVASEADAPPRTVVPGATDLARIGENELSLTRFAALVSEFAFINAEGRRVQLPGQYGALDLVNGRPGVTVRGVPPGDYRGVQFLLGLRPDINHADPAFWPPDHALNPLFNHLHWDWRGGYVFLALEGRYRRPDSSLGGWSYHLATDARLVELRLPHEFTLQENLTLHLEFDLGRALSAIVVSPEGGRDSTHSAPDDVLAARLAQNLRHAVSVVSQSATLAPDAPPSPSAHSAPDSAATPYALILPASFPQVSLPPDNPLTVEGVALGEKLFHDVRLSRGHAQSCASCHDPALAFSDRVALSLGVDGLPGTRNAMPLTNLLWSPAFAWDSAHPLVRDQARAALVNPLEMHADPTTVVRDLSADPDYRAAFAAAFGPATPITPDALFLALEQFLLTRFSADSKFDRVMRGQARFTNQEQAGHALFNAEHDPARGRRGADCFHCHGGALFTDFQPKNNGLDLRSTDTGRAGITGLAADHGKFKTPSLRNIALTSPYMHDGRLATLEAVIAHYDHGVRRSENLDPNLAKHPDAGLGLISDEQAALLAFLHTLTDSRLLPAAPAESPDSAPASY